MSNSKSEREDYSPQEAERRLEQALRGARIAGHKPMKDVVGQKKKSPRQQPKKKPAKKAG